MGKLVAIDGATFSGKTTTVKKLYEKLSKTHNVAIVPEMIRVVCKEHGIDKIEDLRKNKKLFVKVQKEVIDRQIKIESELIDEHEIVITDRSVYSNLMYASYGMYFEGINEICEVFKPNRYNYIFLLEPIPEYIAKTVKPKFRSVQGIKNAAFQHLLLKNILPHYIEIPFDDVDKRVEAIKNAISCPLGKPSCGEHCLWYYKGKCNYR